MSATITTRAITIHMRRRRPDERVDQFREKVVEREAEPIRDALADWITSISDQVADAEPPTLAAQLARFVVVGAVEC